MAHDTGDPHPTAPFEGPEKLLEIWFAPSAADVPDAASPTYNGRTGLRKVKRQVWEEMLDIVQCKVLSVIEGTEMDAYLLSESSFFVSPHRLILKTCGTTLNLLGLPRILQIASTQASLSTVYRCFYSRKSFMFPERQLGPHRDWKHEVEFLDEIFDNGAAYTVGKVNGDHWLLYMTSPRVNGYAETAPSSPITTEADTDACPSVSAHMQDYTIEILMSELSPSARQPFFSNPTPSCPGQSPSSHAQALSTTLGISNIFPPHLTTLDAFAFDPCGYSSNALIKWGDAETSSNNDTDNTNGHKQYTGEGYYTIHVTPEEGWSYASFECNVPLSTSHALDPTTMSKVVLPDLKSLIQRVVRIFQPGRLSLTLFISSKDNDCELGESAVEAAQRVFKTALMIPQSMVGNGKGINGGVNGSKKFYRRTDKINYEFGGYDLAFASFELRP